MSELETISFRVRSTDAPLHLVVKFDGREIFSREITTDPQEIIHKFSDNDAQHKLEIEMSGKTRHHTTLDASGAIVRDNCIEIGNFKISDVDPGYMLTENMIYEHDTNGTTEKIRNKFFGTMGCNGVVTLEFSSPVYLWLLEHM